MSVMIISCGYTLIAPWLLDYNYTNSANIPPIPTELESAAMTRLPLALALALA